MNSSSVIYKLDDGSEVFSDEEYTEETQDILVTIQNNLVDIHTLGCFILLAVSILIGVCVIQCWKK